MAITEAMRKKIVLILKKNGIRKAGIFGSIARGEDRQESDIDIVIEVDRKDFSLLDLVALKLEIERKLRKKADVLMYRSLHPLLREKILKEEIRVL